MEDTTYLAIMGVLVLGVLAIAGCLSVFLCGKINRAQAEINRALSEKE